MLEIKIFEGNKKTKQNRLAAVIRLRCTTVEVNLDKCTSEVLKVKTI